MPAQLRQQSYGKSRVRLSRITRTADRHEFIEMTVAIALDGDFTAAFNEADNRSLVATDTMKNTVYALAHQQGVASIESFGLLLARHFLAEYPQVMIANIDVEERPWTRMSFDGQPHAHSFVGGGSERNVCEINATRHDETMYSGCRGCKF